MKALLKAVRTTLRGDVTLNALVTGGIYTNSTSQSATLPYLVWNHAGQYRTDVNTGQPQIEVHIIRFRTFATSIVTTADALERVEKIFFTTPLPTMDTGTVMQILREGTMIELDPDMTTHGEEVWVSTLQLAVMIQRNPIA